VEQKKKKEKINLFVVGQTRESIKHLIIGWRYARTLFLGHRRPASLSWWVNRGLLEACFSTQHGSHGQFYVNYTALPRMELL